MSTLAIAPTLFDRPGDEPTLDDLIVGAWEGLVSGAVVPCPVCDGELLPAPDTLGGYCQSCGTELS
jgi:hypothetical protein